MTKSRARFLLKEHQEYLNSNLREALGIAIDALGDSLDAEEVINDLLAFAREKNIRLFVRADMDLSQDDQYLHVYFNGENMATISREYILDLYTCGQEGIDAVKKDVERRLLIK